MGRAPQSTADLGQKWRDSGWGAGGRESTPAGPVPFPARNAGKVCLAARVISDTPDPKRDRRNSAPHQACHIAARARDWWQMSLLQNPPGSTDRHRLCAPAGNSSARENVYAESPGRGEVDRRAVSARRIVSPYDSNRDYIRSACSPRLADSLSPLSLFPFPCGPSRSRGRVWQLSCSYTLLKSSH